MLEYFGAQLTSVSRPIIPPPLLPTKIQPWVSAPVEELHGQLFERFN
jgi:hypothetical protein